MQIEMKRIDEIRPNPRSARTHSRKQIRQVADSIRRYGICKPVGLDDEGQIIYGICVVAACKLLNIQEVPTVRLSHLTDDEKRLLTGKRTANFAKSGLRERQRLQIVASLRGSSMQIPYSTEQRTILAEQGGLAWEQGILSTRDAKRKRGILSVGIPFDIHERTSRSIAHRAKK